MKFNLLRYCLHAVYIWIRYTIFPSRAHTHTHFHAALRIYMTLFMAMIVIFLLRREKKSSNRIFRSSFFAKFFLLTDNKIFVESKFLSSRSIGELMRSWNIFDFPFLCCYALCITNGTHGYRAKTQKCP